MAASTTSQKPRFRLGNVVLAPLYWLERSRGWRRRVLLLLYSLIFAFGGLMTWRATSLRNLPDIGDPFDVESFIASSNALPSDKNAFTYYRRAGEKLKISNEPRDANATWAAIRAGWSQASPELRHWVEENRESLDLWQKGAECIEALPESLDNIRWSSDPSVPANMARLRVAGLLEGSRLEVEGDTDGAWVWYRAALRSCQHFRTRSRMAWRAHANILEDDARTRVINWAKNPKTNAKLLRMALNEVLSLDKSIPPGADNLKVDYLAVKHSLSDPVKMIGELERGGSEIRYDEMKTGYDLIWFLKREPERSQRVLKLFIANRLAQVDKPVSKRPPEVGNDPRNPVWSLYGADPSAPPAARAIDPEPFFAWVDSTTLVWRVLPMTKYWEPNIEIERRSRAVLIMTLAEQLYQREHGILPPKNTDLLGPYLKRLPEGYENVAPPESRQ